MTSDSAPSLTYDELLALADRLAADPDVLAQVRFDEHERVCIPAHADDVSEAWLICWCPGQDTGLHDHDGSAAAVLVLDGEMREERLGGTEQIYTAGAHVTVGRHDIHRMHNASATTAVTLHAYSPPLGRMSSYFWSEDGLLQRVTVDQGVTLEPVR